MIKRPIPKGSFNAERAAMAAHVAAEAQRLYPKQIRFRFETSIQVLVTSLHHTQGLPTQQIAAQVTNVVIRAGTNSSHMGASL